MNRVSVALGVVAVLVIAAQCAENREVSANQKATLKVLEQQSAAHAFTLDTIKAGNAAREVRDAKHADSLRQAARHALSKLRESASHTLPDTVLVSVETFVYVTDTLIPACLVCAARLDSARLAARAEREAATLLLSSKDAQLSWWERHDKPHHSTLNRLRDRVGVTCGYGIQKVGTEVHAGPQCGVSIRILP